MPGMADVVREDRRAEAGRQRDAGTRLGQTVGAAGALVAAWPRDRIATSAISAGARMAAAALHIRMLMPRAFAACTTIWPAPRQVPADDPDGTRLLPTDLGRYGAEAMRHKGSKLAHRAGAQLCGALKIRGCIGLLARDAPRGRLTPCRFSVRPFEQADSGSGRIRLDHGAPCPAGKRSDIVDNH